MSRRRPELAMPRFDLNDTLYVLRDNLGKADAFITAAEELIEQCWGETEDEGGDGDDSILRRRNHVAQLIESAKLAVRAAAYTGKESDKYRQGA